MKGLKVDHKNEVIVTWNKSQESVHKNLCFHFLTGINARKIMFYVKDIVSPEVEITDLLINMDYRYYYLSTTTGEISVWKFDNSKK